jgi:hypothetical protein
MMVIILLHNVSSLIESSFYFVEFDGLFVDDESDDAGRDTDIVDDCVERS